MRFLIAAILTIVNKTAHIRLSYIAVSKYFKFKCGVPVVAEQKEQSATAAYQLLGLVIPSALLILKYF